MDNLDIAEHLKKAREIAGLSGSVVAAHSGITENRLARIEKGNSDITMVEFLSLCKIIKVTPAALINKASKRIQPKVTKQNIEEYLSIRETAELLGISEATLRELCRNKEIPCCEVRNNKYLFRWTEIDKWLDMQFNQRLPGKERRHAIRGTRYGIEPLLSEREIKAIFGGSVPTNSDEGRFVPGYRIRSRKRYRLSDILAFVESSRVDLYDIPRFSRGWQTTAFNRLPSQEELDAKRLQSEFSQSRGSELVPGYEWAYINFDSHSIDETETLLKEFKDALDHKWRLAETEILWNGKAFSTNVRYMRIPAAWAGYKVRRANTRADFANLIKIRVNKYIAKKVPADRLIEIRYFTDSFTLRPWLRHCATIFFYEPQPNESCEPGAILNPQAKKTYERLREEATIHVSKQLWKAIKELKNGELSPRKLTNLLKKEGLFDRMDRAKLLIYERRAEVLDVKKASDWSEYANAPLRHYCYPESRDFARIAKISAAQTNVEETYN